MDSLYIVPRGQDSRQCRSRSNSRLSSTAAGLQGVNICNSDSRGTQLYLLHTPSHTPTTTSCLDQEKLRSSTTLVSAPAPQSLIPLPSLAQDESIWPSLESSDYQTSAPAVKLGPAQHLAETQYSQKPLPPLSKATPIMSAVGIQQYDSRFEASLSGIRPSFTWPNFDMNINQQFLDQVSDQSLSQATLTLFDEPKLSPSYSRSLSSSPPRGSLTPEQRELKRQRDHARRDSKTRIRRERSTSNPYVVSQNGSPDLLPSEIAQFSGSLTRSPLLSQESPALAGNGFLTPYSTSMSGDAAPSELYAPVFPMTPGDFTGSPAYNMPFSPAETITLQPQAFMSRPHSLSSASDQQQQQQQRQHYPAQQPQSQIITTQAESADHVRVVHSRPKPQCWEHGCNGRKFSTFSNLLRHQREKSGAAAKSSCPHCGAEFTRTTARNGHMAHEKCKQRRNS